jgi:SAM-dependent methyltransferase
MLSVQDWVWLNRTGAFENLGLREFVCPFPPSKLIYSVSGLENERDFACHGADLFLALSEASPIALTEYKKMLDFGCGCGRLARMFKNWPHELFGCDINTLHIDWINENLKFMKASHNFVHLPLPYADNSFDGIISISVFTHLNEINEDRFLSELHRISQPGARLFLTVHGSRALERARAETSVRNIISVKEKLFQQACARFEEGKHAFILQQNYLTTLRWRLKNLLLRLVGEPNNPLQKLFEYGITFIPESYIRSHWTRWFEIQDFRPAAIHDFQDIVVLNPRK